MGRTPLVSVIMPVYNGSKTINLALKSLLYQTYQNWICVIVNDGSNDETKDILDSLIDLRFKVIHLSKNVGRGAARQIALEQTEGEYLAYLDADDFYHENKLLEQVEMLNNNNDIALVGTKILSFDALFSPISIRGSNTSKIIKYKIGDYLNLCMATAMVRLSDAKKIKYNSKLNAAEDLDYFSRYLDNKFYININRVRFYYSVTESTSYLKILEYSKYEILRGILLFGKNNVSAFKTILISTIKWIIYALTIPVLGTNFFLHRRGVPVTNEEIKNFNNQKSKIIDYTPQ